MTHSSPSSSARVLSEARSLPASGSEKPWHQEMVPLRMPGMNCCFCSSVAHWRMVGPTRVSPKKSARSGASARANSSLSTTDSIRERPLPPYSLGQEAQIQPPSKSFFDPLLVEGLPLVLGHREAGGSPARRAGCRSATGGSRPGTARCRRDRSGPWRPTLPPALVGRGRGAVAAPAGQASGAAVGAARIAEVERRSTPGTAMSHRSRRRPGSDWRSSTSRA